jgi:small acid-soluble spore protein beta
MIMSKTPLKKIIKSKIKSNKELSEAEILREKIKYEIAEELGLKDKVDSNGWGGLTAEETGRIGGIMTKRKRMMKIPTNDEILGRK